jgi:uncharacterized protein YcbK (DUF882 family)
LNVTSSEISETGNLSGHRSAERGAAPDKILSGAQGGDRQRRVLKDLAQGNVSVSGHRPAERSAAPDKILAGAQGGDRQRRVLKDLAQGNVSVSGHRPAERSAAPDKILAGRQGGGQRSVLKDLAPGNFAVSERHGPMPADTEVRRLRLYQVHTGESLAVTYKRDGRYIPSAMAQLDYFLRDWRSNSFVSISVETIDLLWELHEELGSKQPIHVISGFRSAQTNALLKRIGRNVANRSEHILGRAIDVQFPDVPLKLLRNRALMRQAGGVGYYPAGDGGFVHIDSGRVRHWPGIGRTEIAEIFAKPTGGDRRTGDQQAALGSETAVTQQQNGKRAGSIGQPAIRGALSVARSAIDTKFGSASSLASAKALLVRSPPAPGEVAPNQWSKRSLRRQERPSARSVRSGQAGAVCCGPGLRKRAGKTDKNFSLPNRQRQFSERSSVVKKGALPLAYKQVFDVTKRTVRMASAIARKAKSLMPAITKWPTPQRRRTASKSGTDPRCQLAKIAGAIQLRQTAKPRAKRRVPATQNHKTGRYPRKR